MKKILCILNYYYPYISGVSEYARVICEKMVDSGYDVTVLASNHEKLKSTEYINGVKVVRTPVICKISKGTISPEFIFKAKKLSKNADIVWMHLPMIESGIISSFIPSKKLLCVYQCDVNLRKTFLNDFIVKVMDFSNNICLKKCKKIMVTTVDYGVHSRLGKKYKEKLIEAGAPVKIYPRSEKTNGEKKVIGFCGRIVEEKGINVLIQAFGILRKKRNDVILKIGGDYSNIAGGSVYPELKKLIRDEHIEDVEFLGKIPEEQMGAFYSGLDVFVLPSTNSLEAFGMVQLEAMMCGTPVVSSDLYGVREIPKKTGMGVVVKRNNAIALAKGIEEVINNPGRYIKSAEDIAKTYGTEKCYRIYENILENW